MRGRAREVVMYFKFHENRLSEGSRKLPYIPLTKPMASLYIQQLQYYRTSRDWACPSLRVSQDWETSKGVFM